LRTAFPRRLTEGGQAPRESTGRSKGSPSKVTGRADCRSTTGRPRSGQGPPGRPRFRRRAFPLRSWPSPRGGAPKVEGAPCFCLIPSHGLGIGPAGGFSRSKSWSRGGGGQRGHGFVLLWTPLFGRGRWQNAQTGWAGGGARMVLVCCRFSGGASGSSGWAQNSGSSCRRGGGGDVRVLLSGGDRLRPPTLFGGHGWGFAARLAGAGGFSSGPQSSKTCRALNHSWAFGLAFGPGLAVSGGASFSAGAGWWAGQGDKPRFLRRVTGWGDRREDRGGKKAAGFRACSLGARLARSSPSPR